MTKSTPLPSMSIHPAEQGVRFARQGTPCVEILPGLAEAEPVWRALESSGVLSPYQRFDWVHAHAQAVQAEDAGGVQVIVLRSRSGQPLLLLPLETHRRAGIRIASIPGGKHANFQLPVFAGESRDALTPDAVRTSLIQAGSLLNVDAFAFQNVSRTWRGEANPLFLGVLARPNPSNAYKRTLDPDPEVTITHAFGRETRKKLRKKERLLAERGIVSFAQVADEGEAGAVLAAFLSQKSARMRQLGLADPFADRAMTDFLHRACRAGLERGRPAIELYALRLNGDIIATFGGAGDGERLCGMINSFDPAPDLERCSPGEVLLARLLRAQCERGRKVFDLGVGEARYKSSVCDEVEELFDVVVPVSLRGSAYAAASRRFVDLKRRVKHHPVAWRLVQTGRSLAAVMERKRA